MRSLHGPLHEAHKSHVPDITKCGTLQNRERNIPTNLTGVLYWKQKEALDWEWVGVRGPIRWDPELPGGSSAAAYSSNARAEAAVGPTIGGFGCRLPDVPIRRCSLGIAGKDKCPKGGGEWVFSQGSGGVGGPHTGHG